MRPLLAGRQISPIPESSVARFDVAMPAPAAPPYLPDYAPVAERVRLFYERHPDGRIVTELVGRSPREVLFRASVFRTAAEREPAATGWACEREGDGEVNTTSCLENAETSAVGRALANLGFLAGRGRTSAEEIAKAARARARVAAPSAVPAAPPAAPVAMPPRPHLVTDLARLLDRARHAGMRPTRAARWRRRLLAPDRPWTKDELERFEQRLRSWVRRRQG